MNSQPAAGPWRTDVTNAPKDGTEVLCRFGGLTFHDTVVAEWRNGIWQAVGVNYTDSELRAFATINPPETPHVLGE